MNYLAVLQGLFKLIPYVVAGIHVIHANESTETKSQLAQDALGIATQAATAVLGPGDAGIATAVSSAVSAGIQSTQLVIGALKNTPPTTGNSPAVTQ